MRRRQARRGNGPPCRPRLSPCRSRRAPTARPQKRPLRGENGVQSHPHLPLPASAVRKPDVLAPALKECRATACATIRAGADEALRGGLCQASQVRSQGPRRRVAEDVDDAQLTPELIANPALNLERQERVSAEVEEVGRRRYVIQSENVAPDGDERLLEGEDVALRSGV